MPGQQLDFLFNQCNRCHKQKDELNWFLFELSWARWKYMPELSKLGLAPSLSFNRHAYIHYTKPFAVQITCMKQNVWSTCYRHTLSCFDSSSCRIRSRSFLCFSVFIWSARHSSLQSSLVCCTWWHCTSCEKQGRFMTVGQTIWAKCKYPHNINIWKMSSHHM